MVGGRESKHRIEKANISLKRILVEIGYQSGLLQHLRKKKKIV
jgi:hypothetical protein